MLIYVAFIIVSIAVWLSGFDITVVTGTLFGGGLSMVNFNILKWVGRKIVEDPKRLKIQYFALVWFKFVMLVGFCFFTIVYWSAYFNIIAFFVSLGVIIVAVVTATVVAIYQGFTDLIDEDWQKTEEKYIGWDDVDNPDEKDYKTGSKKGVFDRL
ncbi:MAG: hypothetical protein P9L99_17560 [Candidatus Lernaella stagnicola]|nr:hypothetical protein [Candidatus Lernaella stagnicola]